MEWSGTGSKWNFTEASPCVDMWQGVTCSSTPVDGFLHVLEVKLFQQGLVGTMPQSLPLLPQLTYLTLGGNQLSGTIPENIGQLPQLTALFLDTNQLTGTLPAAIGQLTNLVLLYLDVNVLTGTIPDELGELTQLTSIYIELNAFTGTIPDTLALLVQAEVLSVGNNHLVGTIPAGLTALTQLEFLDLGGNQLVSSIPDSFGQLTQLKALFLESNLLTGTLPDSLKQLEQLELLLLLNNRLSGTIPGSLSDLTQLVVLELDINHFTGSIPDSLGQLSRLADLGLDTNHLTGVIPDSLGQLTSLKVLYLQGNKLTGTIPQFFGHLPGLLLLEMGNNHLHGTVPQNWTGTAITVQVLLLNANHLSGAIPEALGHMPLLQSLNLSSNHFTRTIPASFQQLTSLHVLMLHNNHLQGSVAELFNPQQKNLTTVQLSGNQLTGTLPAAVFQLPGVNSFAAVGNCFDGSLPEEAICSSMSLSALVLDGMHSASSCKQHVLGSHSAFKLGTLPSCLLTMPNLATLHLSGSGLTGSLPAEANISAVLTDLSLSHNLLTGKIPGSILDRGWQKLDLSYNRISGTLHSASAASYGNTTKLFLKQNRLSGVIPGSMQRVGTLSLLEDNMFSCRVDRSDVPQQASDSDKYTCGSDAVNSSLYAWLGAAVAIMATAGVYTLLGSSTQQCRDWLAAVRLSEVAKLQDVFQVALLLSTLGVGSAVYCIVVLLPVYAVVNAYHSSFTYKYAWTVSGVFLTGTTAFAVEAVFLLLQLPICAYMAERLLPRHGTRPPPSGEAASSATSQVAARGKRQVAASAATMLLSLGVVTGTNVAFVMATLRLNGRQLTVIQILLAVFKLGFNNVVAPALLNRIRTPGPGHRVTISQLVLVLLNVIVIPCVVVMVISPACFYGALTGIDPVTSRYEFIGKCESYFITISSATGEAMVTCSALTTEVGTTTYTPPFGYSYQCSSSFVTSYAPTYVIMCIISGFILPALRLLLLWLLRNLSPTSRLYAMVTVVTPRILKELPSPQDLAGLRCDPWCRPIHDANKLTMVLLTYLSLLLTFGALFPPLAVCCAVAMASVVLTARLMVGRYVTAAVAADRQDCVDEVESACAGVATPQQLRTALYLVLAVSCLFYTLFLFDTLGDAVGFTGAFWVLIVVPLLPVMSWAL
jgi:Leucine-rich repeat (LRR) protein